jgi:5'-nucleotidase (lipoprotein e(P4) family)
MKNIALATVLFVGLAAFSSDNNQTDSRQNAVLWFATSAESEACFLQAYAAADAQLTSLGRPNGSQVIVADLDETVFNNAAWSAASIIDGTDFPTGWDAWEKKAAAPAMPGSVEFFTRADKEGFEIRWISNRDQTNIGAIISNMKALGLPQADAEHLMLKTTTVNKEPRRAAIKAQGKEIVLNIGDNISDFIDVPANATEGRRVDSVRAHKASWGKKFIVLPNPMYGDWFSSLIRAATPTNKANVLADRVGALSQPAR